MKLNKHEIAFNYRQGIVLDDKEAKNKPEEYFIKELTLNLASLGFVLTQEAYESLLKSSVRDVKAVYNNLVPAIKAAIGANVRHKPMYPNFPEQVADMEEIELYWNAIMHYWSGGQWLPEYNKIARKKEDEEVKMKEIRLLTEDDFMTIFKNLASSNDSISETDKATLSWFVENEDIELPDEIPHKEVMCFLAGLLYGSLHFRNLLGRVNTATDILRVVTALSDGDVSLAENTKFKSLPRAVRRLLISRLEEVINAEDIRRHEGKWGKLFHMLHIGESNATKAKEIAQVIRDNGTIRTFNSHVEDAILKGDHVKVVNLLEERPSEFARRLDQILRLVIPTQPKKVMGRKLASDLADTSKHPDITTAEVLLSFAKGVDKVSTRVITQVYGHFSGRNHSDFRVILPKGNTSKAVVLEKDDSYANIPEEVCRGVLSILSESLKKRFAELDDLGKVYLDEALKDCPLPSAQRSASSGLLTVARGTKLPFGDKKTLRLFVHWKGNDIDLSATFYGEDFGYMEHISYTNLKSSKYKAYHSGDITSAPKGASEFIDIDIESAISYGARYVMQQVYSYSRENFVDVQDCFVGWMTRNKPNSNEIYDPKTVEQKINLTSETVFTMPVIFDLVEKKAIWLDITSKERSSRGGNNFESNSQEVKKMLEAMVTSTNKMSLYDLFKAHAESRGTIVEDMEEAETIFSMTEGFTPFEIDKINSDFLV